MNASGKFSIEKQAKSKGGDRYSGILSNGPYKELTRIYLPQTVSRRHKKKPSATIDIKISLGSVSRNLRNNDEENTDGVLCTLTKAAKSNGGDRYDGEINEEIISVYISQVFTRAAVLADASSKSRPFQRMLITFSRPNDAPPKSRAQSPIAPSSLGKRSRQSSLPQSSPSSSIANPSAHITFDEEAEFEEDVEIQPNLVLGKTSHLGSTTEVTGHPIETPFKPIETHFEAFEEKRRDDSIIESICDASGCFDLDLYFRMKMVRPDLGHLVNLEFSIILINAFKIDLVSLEIKH